MLVATISQSTVELQLTTILISDLICVYTDNNLHILHLKGV